jgi:hypothetical protein
MAKKHDLSEKTIPVCHAPLPLNANSHIQCHAYNLDYKTWRAEILAPGVF